MPLRTCPTDRFVVEVAGAGKTVSATPVTGRADPARRLNGLHSGVGRGYRCHVLCVARCSGGVNRTGGSTPKKSVERLRDGACRRAESVSGRYLRQAVTVLGN